MRTAIKLLLSLAIAVFLTSCAFLQTPSKVWEPDERSGIGKADSRQHPLSISSVERLIPVRIDHQRPSAGNFDLYYFVRMPAKGKATKTVLFCAGGPGQIVYGPMSGSTFADFLTDNGYNVVYFHQRGAGFSQIPASNQYDKFLRTSYAIEDMEAIRRDFLGENGKWDAIIGWSYGTVVAQQYAYVHGDNLARLILIGPMSRHKFKTSATAIDGVFNEIRSTDRQTLSKIYGSPLFDDLSPDQKKLIVDKIFEREGILDRAEEAFGSLQFVIDSYCELARKNELQRYGLNSYSSEFFKQLRSLRMFGWPPESDTTNQDRIGHRLKEEILYSRRMIDDCSGEAMHDSPGSSKRAFYVTSTYDGLNMPFLREWHKNDRQKVLDALKKSGGEANILRNVNEQIGKIGIRDDETIHPLDPAHYKHDRPTLILKGSADTVPAGGAAEYIFRNALVGPRTFIDFPGVGHSLDVPEISFDERIILSGTLRANPVLLLGDETRQVSGTYQGRNPNENLSLQVDMHDLEQGLQLSGFGISAKNPNGSLAVIALIENKGTQSIEPKNRKWRINTPLFSGIVELKSPKIDPDHKVLAHGTTTAAWLNEERAIRVEKPADLKHGLEPLCSQIRFIDDGIIKGNVLEMWIKNNSDQAIPETAKSWTVSTNQFSSTFSIDPGTIEPSQIHRTSFNVDRVFLSGLELERTEWINLNPGEKLVSCIQAQGEGKVSVFIYNPEDSNSEPGPQKLTIRTGRDGKFMFTRTYKIDHLDSIPSRQGVVVQLENPTYTWRQTPVLNAPGNLNPELELVAWNVVDENQLSMLLRNNSENSANSAAGEWVYIDPTEELVACMMSSALRDCLIYSFLVMSPEAFISDQDNKLLHILQAEPLPAHVCHRNGNEQGYRKPANDSCP
jgi:pimeloyl-ACP methyl ester carboxylesterase